MLLSYAKFILRVGGEAGGWRDRKIGRINVGKSARANLVKCVAKILHRQMHVLEGEAGGVNILPVVEVGV